MFFKSRKIIRINGPAIPVGIIDASLRKLRLVLPRFPIMNFGVPAASPRVLLIEQLCRQTVVWAVRQPPHFLLRRQHLPSKLAAQQRRCYAGFPLESQGIPMPSDSTMGESIP